MNIARSGRATQAALEAETDEATYASPNRVKFSPGVAKGWISFDGTGVVSILASYNVTSLVDDGTGQYTVNWNVDFSGANYAVAAMSRQTTAAGFPSSIGIQDAPLAGATDLAVVANSNFIDLAWLGVVVFGDQA